MSEMTRNTPEKRQKLRNARNRRVGRPWLGIRRFMMFPEISLRGSRIGHPGVTKVISMAFSVISAESQCWRKSHFWQKWPESKGRLLGDPWTGISAPPTLPNTTDTDLTTFPKSPKNSVGNCQKLTESAEVGKCRKCWKCEKSDKSGEIDEILEQIGLK